MKRALVSGIVGQTGSYLAEHLLSLGYEVSGIVRRTSHHQDWPRLRLCRGDVNLFCADLTDQASLSEVIVKTEPDEVYNLAAMSYVAESWSQPTYTFDVEAMGTLRMLEAVRSAKNPPLFYQASSSEMFGNASAPQSESTAMIPRSPYGVAKLAAHAMVKVYRESYRLFACSGIAFNHESPRRGSEFVTSKIARAVARNEPLKLGNLDARRDWGYAGDYVKAMHLMLQAEEPKDYVIATGDSRTVRQFCEIAYAYVGRQLEWDGAGDREVGIVDGKAMISIDPSLYRPAEVNALVGNPALIARELGWRAETKIEDLIAMMVEAEKA